MTLGGRIDISIVFLCIVRILSLLLMILHNSYFVQVTDDKDKHLQLLRCRLFPSTTMKPQTAFTFDVLDQFLMDELECKTSASSFYSKLRRLTNSTFPDSLPVSFHVSA